MALAGSSSHDDEEEEHQAVAEILAEEIGVPSTQVDTGISA